MFIFRVYRNDDLMETFGGKNRDLAFLDAYNYMHKLIDFDKNEIPIGYTIREVVFAPREKPIKPCVF